MNKLHSWFSWFNRQKITIFIGFIVLVLGVIFPWYRLPPQALETFGTNLFWANLARFTVAFFIIVGCALAIGLNISRAARLSLWTALLTALLFPYFITTWSPTVDFIASSYYKQGQKVSTHVDKNFSEIQSQWKQNISLDAPDTPPSIFEISIQDSLFFQMPSWEKIVLYGLGYKNSFFTFIGKGWSFALIGLIISLFGFYLGERNASLNIFIQDMKLFLPGAVLLLVLILSIIISINIVNSKLDTQFAKGEYFQVANTSKVLTLWYPPLQGDEVFLERLARAEFYADIPDIALINFVKGLEKYRISNFQEAENYFQKSLDIQPHHFLTRGYLVAAILNQGVNYLNKSNTRKPGAAADIFEKAVSIYPSNIEALYDLMLARVVNGEFHKSAEVAKQIINGQQYFQEPRIGLLGQAYLHLAWDEYSNSNVNQTWERYRQSVDTKAWNKSAVEEE
ncbi:hypothetical protein [Nostoc sp. NMS8]|uniref:tetratricopeptide repeat protein n=1 Tax=Nostoc sp. NMS8 TaxID=2815392 RepID=UPI0025EFF3D2|nr:hypothetical protein [Nostoc sp. NMS8]MBN3962487.1 hypothetical protein [Nostoc sp. NMS8]